MLPLVYHPDYSFPFPGEHRFPMEKFSLLHQHLRSSGIAQRNNEFRPGRARPSLLGLAHCPEYVEAIVSGSLDQKALRRMGLPWSEGLMRRTCIAPMGTLLTAQLALKHGLACHLAGGTHHAHYDFGSGFCIFNDLAFAAKHLLASGAVEKILIFDCDVHQGDGTAAMLAEEPRVFTCSIHCEKNFPVRKMESDLDVGLPLGMTDRDYLDTVFETLEGLLERVQPDLVLYDAGVDIYEQDPLGLLAISLQGIADRDRGVIQRCRNKGIPVATVIGGGYDDDRYALARRHALVIEEAARIGTLASCE
ncbi:histone deacetylase [Alcanivorax sp. S6407]|uniref:histone deacetylase family protein n=1 Tax=Alcanivorax sp. S6407 TaxID=2926424 RepID=UPI001FF46CB9|nr:histone deacetylase [Alcanivorax sp. S6407]MCK0153738.1 histone deacetylase [Alcanivorax sp. S6407]